MRLLYGYLPAHMMIAQRKPKRFAAERESSNLVVKARG